MAVPSKQISSNDLAREKTDTARERIWPYLVLVSCYLSYVVSTGFNFGVVGSITEAQKIKFNATLDQSSWTGSVHTAVFLSTAPFSAMLTRMISLRKVQLIGAILSLLGIGLCSVAVELWQATLCFGLIAGVGLGLTRAAAVAVTVYHFEKEKLDFATGSTMMGYTTGLALFPSMTSYIFEHFGFSHAMLIFTPFMMLHFLGVGTYSQTQRGLMGCNQTVDSTLRKSLLQIAHNGRVWAYIWCAFFRIFGWTAFFIIIDDFIIKTTTLTLREATLGSTVLGVCAIFGGAMILALHRFPFSRLLPHSFTILAYSFLMFGITFATTKIVYIMIMAMLGACYGVQIANLVPVAHELVGARDMVLVFGFESFMQGAGSLAGGIISSTLQERVGERYGLYTCSLMCLIAGLMVAAIAIHQCVLHTCKKTKHPTLPDVVDAQNAMRESLLIASREETCYKSINISQKSE